MDNKIDITSNISTQFVGKNLTDAYLHKEITELLQEGSLKEIAIAVRRELTNDPKLLKKAVNRIANIILKLRYHIPVMSIARECYRDPGFISCLLIITKASGSLLQHIEDIGLVASRAITILNKARINFSHMDLSNINIPNAELSGATCEGTSFVNSNLSNVNFEDAWLNHAQFINSQMHDIEFGILSSLQFEEKIMCFAYSYYVGMDRNYKWLAIGVGDDVHLYDVETRKLNKRLDGHKNLIIKVAFSRSGKFLVSGGADNVLRIWSSLEQSSPIVRELRGHKAPIRSLIFSPNEKWLASGSEDNSVRLWGGLEEEEYTVNEFRGHADWVSSLAFNLNEKWLASGSDDNSVRLWSLDEATCKSELRGHTGQISKVIFSPNGLWLVSSSFDKTIRLWGDLENDSPTMRQLTGHKDWVRDIAFSANGQWLASADQVGILLLWDMRDYSQMRSPKALYGHKAGISTVDFNADSQWLVSGSDDSTIRLWGGLANEELIVREFRGHTDSVSSVVFSHDEKLIVSCGHDKTIRFWKTAHSVASSVQESQEPQEPIDMVTNVTLSPDGNWMVSCTKNNTMRLWGRLHSRSPIIKELPWGLESVNGLMYDPDIRWVRFSPDSQWAAYSNPDGILFLLGRLDEHEPNLKELREHVGLVNAAVFDSNSNLLVSAGSDRTLRFWDVASGCELGIFTVEFAVQSVCWNGDLLVTGHQDGVVSAWNVSTMIYANKDARPEAIQPTLLWRHGRASALTVFGAALHGAQLSEDNRQLLSQKGAFLESRNLLRNL